MTPPRDGTGGLTKAQRQAYIDTARRCQPIEDLKRKARKANRKGWRRVYAGVEGTDLALAENWRWYVKERPHFVTTFRLTFCNLCGAFAPEIGEPVQHKIRCSANAYDDGPYPGWIAAGRAALDPASHPHTPNRSAS